MRCTAVGLSGLRSLWLNALSAFRARESRTSADRLRMIRRRLLLVERSLHGGAAELQETELPSLTLLPFVTPQLRANAARDSGFGKGTSTRSLPAAMQCVALQGELSAPQVAERIWEAVDEGNRMVLIGSLFELSKHSECFRGVSTDATLVRTPSRPPAPAPLRMLPLLMPPCCDSGAGRSVSNRSARVGLPVAEQRTEATSAGAHAPRVLVLGTA